MDAVILAGGYGTRLRPLTYTRPKPLLPVAGRPMIDWVLDGLPQSVDHVVVAVNWLAEKLEAHFETKNDGRKYTVLREDKPLGTAGAVKNVASALGRDPFFVLNGDIVSNMDLQAMIDAHQANGAEATLSLYEVAEEDVVNYGVASIGATGKNGACKLQGFVEKPPTPDQAPSQLINAGAYLMEPSVLDRIPANQMYSMEKEVFPQILAAEAMWGLPFTGTWIDVGDPTRLRAASTAMDPSKLFGPKAQIEGTVTDTIGGRNVVIEAGATLTGCVLGDDVTICSGVNLNGAVIGDGETVVDSTDEIRIWSRNIPAGYPDKQVGNAMPGK